MLGRGQRESYGPRIEPARVRVERQLLALGGGVYFIWWFLVESLLPGSYNPLGSRLAIVLLFVGALVASYTSRVLRDRLRLAKNVCVWALTSHYYFLLLKNHGTTPWATGAFIVAVAVSACIDTRAALVGYSVFTLGLALLVSYAAPELVESIFFPGLATMLLLSNVALQHRLSLAKERFERLQSEAQVAWVQEEVRKRDEFIALASHELRTPLSALALSIEHMTRASTSDAQNQRAIARCERQVRRLERLVSAMLDSSELASHELILRTESVRLLELVRDVISRLTRDLSSDTPVEVRGDEDVRGDWDRTRIEQVVTNLLRNALVFGAGRPVKVVVEGIDRSAVLSVADQGIGIPVEEQSRIFERFERAVSPRNYGGMGLGLFVVHKIVRAHGGSVRVDSAPNAGATFVVELPRSA